MMANAASTLWMEVNAASSIIQAKLCNIRRWVDINLYKQKGQLDAGLFVFHYTDTYKVCAFPLESICFPLCSKGIASKYSWRVTLPSWLASTWLK